MNTFFYIFTALALIGVVLNIRQDRRGFLLWMVSNMAFAVQSFIAGIYNMTLLFLVQFFLSVWGVYSWK